MKIIETKTLNNQHKKSILQLWNQEYPAALSFENINSLEEYLNEYSNTTHYFLYKNKAEFLGWACLFERNQEVWFAIIIDSRIQKKGFGKSLINIFKTKQSTLNAWVIDHHLYVKKDGSSYFSPLGFYLKNNFIIKGEQRIELKKITAVKIEWKKD